MKSLQIIKDKINKHAFEIIKNIELISYLPPNLLDSYFKFLKNFNRKIDLYKYLEKNWFKNLILITNIMKYMKIKI